MGQPNRYYIISLKKDFINTIGKGWTLCIKYCSVPTTHAANSFNFSQNIDAGPTAEICGVGGRSFAQHTTDASSWTLLIQIHNWSNIHPESLFVSNPSHDPISILYDSYEFN